LRVAKQMDGPELGRERLQNPEGRFV